MPKAIFIAATGNQAEKHEGTLAIIAVFNKSGHKVGYFKPIAPDLNDPSAENAKKKGALINKDWYALSCQEAADLMANGNETAIIEKILPAFHQAALECDVLVVEGADLEGALAPAIFNLNTSIAASLGCPVLLISEGGNEGAAQTAALSIASMKNNKAQVIACAITKSNDSIIKVLEKLTVAKGLSIYAIEQAADLFAPATSVFVDKIINYQSQTMSPKLFEYNLIQKAKKHKQHIVLPEGEDDRILTAAANILNREFCNLTILGNPETIKGRAKELNLDLNQAQLVEPQKSPWLEEFSTSYTELRKHKGMTLEKAKELMIDANYFATMMVYSKKADGLVSGASSTTAATVRPALQIIKTKPGCSIASSIFLMCLEDRVHVYGDCAITIEPNPQQAAEIAITSAQTAAAFGIEPLVAMLSYSTGSSGTGSAVESVKEATAIAIEAAAKTFPGLKIDGPLQFDAAVDPATAKSKMPNSEVAGKATVMIFPDLNSGNIAYKAVQRMAGAIAIGPVIQGLNSPVNDLSRGCLVPDIINTVAITALQAQFDKGLN